MWVRVYILLWDNIMKKLITNAVLSIDFDKQPNLSVFFSKNKNAWFLIHRIIDVCVIDGFL